MKGAEDLEALTMLSEDGRPNQATKSSSEVLQITQGEMGFEQE